MTHDGEFFKHTGLWTLARPVQEKLPIKLGAMGGPRSFEVGGELFDGVHQAIGTSRETYEYMVEHVRKGAAKAGRNVDDLDIGAWLVMSVMEDSAAAKETARIMAAFYLSAMPEQQLNRHGISGADLKPIFDAFGAGDVPKALELTTPELGEKFSVAGTPDEVVGASRARHHLDRRQPHHRRGRRPVPRQGVHRHRRPERGRHARAAAADPRPGHAGAGREPPPA